MFLKPNTKQRRNQELSILTFAPSQPAPAANRRGILLSLIEPLKKLINLIKGWFQQRRMAPAHMGYQIMMKRKSPFDDHDEGGKRAASVQSSKYCCGICFDYKPESDMFRGRKCRHHPFCTDCISKHVAAQIRQNVLKVNCPNPNCSVKLKPEHFQTILPKEVIDRWECARCESSIPWGQKTYCPFKNCSVLLVNDGGGGNVVTSCECPSCHRLFCAQCKVPWHAGMNCKEFQRKKGEKDLDRKFLELAKGKMWQKCPKCSIFVQRRSGCEHMTCRLYYVSLPSLTYPQSFSQLFNFQSM